MIVRNVVYKGAYVISITKPLASSIEETEVPTRKARRGGRKRKPFTLPPPMSSFPSSPQEEEHEALSFSSLSLRGVYVPPEMTIRSPSSEGQEELVLCSCGNDHQDLESWGKAFIADMRDTLGLAPVWSITLLISCPQDMPGGEEGVVQWDQEVWFAQIRLRCDLPVLLMEWVLWHELLELKFYRTGDIFFDLCQMVLGIVQEPLVDYFLSLYRKARNQEIEQLVHEQLGTYRPAHLSAPILAIQENDEKKSEQGGCVV